MSISSTHKTVPILETGHTATIRKLKGRHLHAAQIALQQEQVDRFSAWTAIQAKLVSLRDGIAATDGGTVESEAPPAAVDPCAAYDAATIARCGVVSLSTGDEPTQQYFDEQDDDVLECLREAILRYTKPSLFLSQADQEAEQKNA